MVENQTSPAVERCVNAAEEMCIDIPGETPELRRERVLYAAHVIARLEAENAEEESSRLASQALVWRCATRAIEQALATNPRTSFMRCLKEWQNPETGVNVRCVLERSHEGTCQLTIHVSAEDPATPEPTPV